MAVFTYVPKQIRTLESHLKVKLPKNVASRPRTELRRLFKERFERRKAQWLEVSRLLAEARAPFTELLKKDKRYAVNVEAIRKLSTGGMNRARARRPRIKQKFDPRFIANSGLTVRVPPYDYWQDGVAGSVANAYANSDTGQYNLSLLPDISSASAFAGVAVNFFSPINNLSQRVGVLVDYEYHWDDFSVGGTAHNDGATNVWVWGFTEGGWVHHGIFDPSWSDGTSWFDHHGSGGDGSYQSGRESLEVFFPVLANSVYQVWVFSQGSCDDDWASNSEQSQDVSVPLMVLG